MAHIPSVTAPARVPWDQRTSATISIPATAMTVIKARTAATDRSATNLGSFIGGSGYHVQAFGDNELLPRGPAVTLPLTVVVHFDYISTMSEQPKAIAYVRVSTTEQATDGVSLDAQRSRISAWCTANGYELAAVHVDAGLSGSKAHNRPALQLALTEACRAKAALVVYSLSRLARSTKDAIAISERLDKSGADLVSLSEQIDTTTAAGKMVFRMLAVLAEFERDLISERTSTAMQHKRSRGEYTGGLEPYGWRRATNSDRLEPCLAEQAIAQEAASLRDAGLSLRAIGGRLEAEGRRPRGGGRWHAKTVRDLLEARAA